MTKMFNTFLASLLHHGPATSRLDYVTFKWRICDSQAGLPKSDNTSVGGP
jgi:hypothetical protein